jgi:hypothetical protein
MRVGARCKPLQLTALTLAALLTGCPAPPPAPAPVVPAGRPPSAATAPAPLPHLGRPFDIAAAESLLTILVYRGGTLASAGHNHVIASHTLRGTIYVAARRADTSFEIHVPVADLSVDEPQLRAQQPGTDFAAEVPESARTGTKRNMLGSALLDADDYPEIVLQTLGYADAGSGAASQGVVQARVFAQVRGQQRTLLMPVRYDLDGATVTASGDIPLKQSELGLTPFSALLGALQVKDEMRVQFHIVAHAAQATPTLQR